MKSRPSKGQHEPTPLRGGEVSARIQAARSTLVPSELKVIELIVADPQRVLTSSAAEVAVAAGTAESTVIRACQRIGFKGFHDVKLALARDTAVQTRADDELERSRDLGPGTPRTDIPALVLRESAIAISDALQTLDVNAFADAVGSVADAKRVLVIGNGTSAAPAHDVAYRLATLGLVSSNPADAFGQHLAAHSLDERDVLIAISHTGATRETLTPAEVARQNGARVVAVTSYARSALTVLADHVLVAGGPELGFRQEAMTSRLAHLAVLDSLFVGVALTRPKRSREFLDVMARVTAEHSL
ncbi:MurR/RpiR family transcriptional regulator [Acrocarpospora macrocephala]|uniref:RpiR family transcriptional regulator n=1 Tax=Acrocarpospora macrocephala TaxID=150177 RepID=A0A5M3WDX4_9ACTN|nr:MurR/RpiR family transcriptional regulator [Acrocarpospora macrocephala]GES07144.1 RpiR family transcriptional regulator [Acrocarpospora macrocephala]